MDDLYSQETSAPPSARRRVLEELRSRLDAVTRTLANSKIDAGELREDADELTAVMHRIEWLADVSNPGP
jgi:phage terminase Nu1 subunit (DNA packaging protein)